MPQEAVARLARGCHVTLAAKAGPPVTPRCYLAMRRVEKRRLRSERLRLVANRKMHGGALGAQAAFWVLLAVLAVAMAFFLFYRH